MWAGLRATHAVGVEMPVLAVCLVAGAFFSVVVPGFASASNLSGILIASLPLLLLATGQTFVLVSGGIDLSAPAMVGFVSVVGGLLMSADSGLLGGHAAAPFAGVLAMLATGAAAGLANGLCVGVLGMPPFMVTLTLGMCFGGTAVLAVRLAGETDTMFNLPPPFIALGAAPQVAVAIALGAAFGAQRLLGVTRYGRMLQAVGYNASTAAASGIAVPRTTAHAYVVSGVFAALAAIVLTGRLETASPTHGRPLLLDVLGATILGGTSLSGGRGTVWGTALGVLFLGVLSNGLTLLNLSEFVIAILKGLLILVAAIVDRIRVRP